MKTRLLKRLREEARMHYSPMFLREFALSLGWSYTQANKYIRTKQRVYILRRVAELKGKRKMKTNRQINECHCDNCRKYEECQAKGVFDDDPGFDFCVNYEDVSYPDEPDDKND